MPHTLEDFRRRAAGYSIKRLSDYSGVSRRTIGKFLDPESPGGFQVGNLNALMNAIDVLDKEKVMPK